MRSLYKGADMTSKQRAYLKGLAMNLDPIFQIGKSSLTPEVTQAVAEALEARELIKITVLKNCLDDCSSDGCRNCNKGSSYPRIKICRRYG